VAGQLATLAMLRLIGAEGLRIGPLLGVESLLVLSNLLLTVVGRQNWPAARSGRLVGPVLATDTGLLTALLAFSGGPMNPYTIFFLVHVVMAAVLLSARWTWAIVALSAAGYASLFVLAPVSPHALHGDAFAGHLYGMLSSFGVASACAAYFVLLAQRERRRAERRAAEAREAAAGAEAFAAVAAVAAGAAHELATPLATIAVAARELERSAGRAAGGGDIAADARLIREEVDRCRRILDALSPPAAGERAADLSPAELLAATLDRLGAAGRRVTVESAGGGPIRLPRQRTAQAAAALLQNALDAGDGHVRVACDATAERLVFRVDDDGPGIPPDLRARLGQPFVTTKPTGRGLGLFLVYRFVASAGGRLAIDSREDGGGTRVTMVLPAAEAAA
jgi:two-component system sensor histidine kinase RegB